MVSAKRSFWQIGTSLSALEKARNSIVQAVATQSTGQPDTAKQPNAAEQSSAAKQPGTSAAKPGTDDTIEEITRWAANEVDISSIPARGLLMERAFLSYRKGPLMGQGLDAAHVLQPHNTFLLFAIAGDIGWLVPLAFLALTAWWARNIRQIPLLLATTTVMMTSHDLLFTPGLLAPIVFGIAGLIWQRYPLNDALHAPPALPYIVLAVPLLFALGGLFVLSATTFPVVPQLLLFLVFCTTTLWSACVWRLQGN